MGLQELWFFIIAALFLGFVLLEGFDFGVGMLMAPFGMAGRASGADPEQRRRAALNTIGPVWDANEVWLITAGAAMFAAFPNWYATLFSALYLPLLAILVGMIVRVVGIEWRGKIDDPRWRAWADAGIAAGSWLPAILWGVAFAILVQGLPIDADGQAHLAIGDVLNGYTLLGGLATASLFAFYGAVFVALKTAGPVRDDAFRFARVLSLPVVVFAGGFGLWTQLAHGRTWTWLPLGIAVIALLTAVALMWTRRREGWAFTAMMVVIAAVVVLLFGSMYPNLLPSTLNADWSVTIYNGSSTPYTLAIMSWASLTLLPLVLGYQAWTYWVFRRRITADAIPRLDRIVAAIARERPRRPAPVARIDRDAPLPRVVDRMRRPDRRRHDRIRGGARRHRGSGDHRSGRAQPGPPAGTAVDSAAAVDIPNACHLAAGPARSARGERGDRRPQPLGADGDDVVVTTPTRRAPR